LRRFAASTGLGLLLMLLIAGAIADRAGPLALFVPGTSVVALGLLYLAFPHGPTFSLGASTGLAMYACLYVVIGRAAFPQAAAWALPIAHALPIAVFVAVCLLRRDRLRRFTQRGERGADLAHLPLVARWLGATALVGVISLSAPLNRLNPDGQALVLLAAMGAIALIAATAVGDVVRLLVDMAVIFRSVTRRLEHVAVPMAAYTSLWALLVVVFGCLYRIADALSLERLFADPAGPLRLSFSDALHFSVVTISTVGYGDLVPRDDGIRLLASIQMLLGQLLLLFGFVEIMRVVRQGPAEAADGATAPMAGPIAAPDAAPHEARRNRPGLAGD
jgi:hypothetical protein